MIARLQKWLNRRRARRHAKWLRKHRVLMPKPWDGAIVKNWKEPT